MKVRLVIQTFGKKSEYKRAILTVLSFFSKYKNVDATVALFTDFPSFFKNFLADLPIEYKLLTPEKIKNYRGKIDFLHRMKIEIIEDAFTNDEVLFYADSDTFFIQDPSEVINKATGKHFFMHLEEYQFKTQYQEKELKTPEIRSFLELVNQTSTTTEKSLNVSLQHSSWNAGVMVFHPDHKKLLPYVYQLTEEWFPRTKCHACEQFAFSVVFQNNETIKPCDDVVYHYWYRTKKEIVDLILKKYFSSTFEKLSRTDKLLKVDALIKLLPQQLATHQLMLKDNAVQLFNTNDYSKAYLSSFKALLKKPWDFELIKDVLYHTKRRITK